MDSVLHIALCDDEPGCRSRLAHLTQTVMDRLDQPYRIWEYDRSEVLLEALESGQQFHILLLDVMMPELDGMALAAALRRFDRKTPIIFVSSNREMALRGYEVSAVRFLAKPVEESKLEEALTHCYRNWLENRKILLPTEQGQHRISFMDIEYVEAFERGTRFVLERETVCSRLKFGQVQELLPQASFVLCHRAYIVNLAHVRRLRDTGFEMRSGDTVPISRYRMAEAGRRFSAYIAD